MNRVWLVVLMPVTAGLWAVAGYASVSFLDTFRLMATNDLDGWGDGVHNLDGGTTLFFWSVFAAAFLEFAVSWQATKAFATFKAGTTLGGFVAAGGSALGLLSAWLAGRWTRPRVVEQSVAYHAPWLLPLLLGIIAVIAAWRFVVAHGRRWPATKAAEIKEHGITMPGTIDRVEFSDTWVDVTVTYVGKYGPRQATRRFAAPAAPTPGDLARVWYDPLGDDGTVLIELTDRNSWRRGESNP